MELRILKSLIEVNNIKIKASDEELTKLCIFVAPKKLSRTLKRYYRTDTVPSDKSPLQLKQILSVLPSTPEEAITNEQWTTAVSKLPEFRTRQPIERIIAFYKKRMLIENLIAAA